jgi:HEAT repeat protein
MTATTEIRPVPSSEIVIDRQELAAEVVDFVLRAQSRIVILHGKLGSGKTELLTRWVLPGLRQAIAREGREVFYGECTPYFPEEVVGQAGPRNFRDIRATRAIVVVDSFESVFELGRDQRSATLDRLFEQVQGKDSQAVVVLVTDNRHLTSVYALTSYDPDIMNAVFEIKPIGIIEGLEQLREVEPETAPAYDADVYRQLSDEASALEEQGWSITFNLITFIDAYLRQHRGRTGEAGVTLQEWRNLGGLPGILRAYLEERLEQLDAEREGNREIAAAILERVYDARAQGVVVEFTDIPARLGVSLSRVQAVAARLMEPPAVLRYDGSTYEVVPPQLGVVLRENVTNASFDTERPRRIVEEGLKSWQVLGNLLPRARFEEVHRIRTRLVLPSDAIRFLLLCAIRYEDGGLEGASEYWLRRITDPTEGMDLLLFCLFDETKTVRLRAAVLLQGYPEPEVRERLYVLALSDPDNDVRAQAVSSLAPMADEGLLQLFLQEAHDPKSPHRAEAVEALRIFPTQPVTDLLQTLVSDPGTDAAIRTRAIHVLAMLGLPQAVDALVDISLHDEDPEDREASANALASIQSQELNRRLLARLQASSTMTRPYLSRIVLSAIALVGAAVYTSLVVESRELLLGSVLLLLPTGLLLSGIRRRQIPRRSLLGVLTGVFYALCAVSVFYLFHGVAHLLVGRWRRALVLLGAEFLGGMLIFVTPWIVQSRGVLEWAYDALGYTYWMVGALLFLGSYFVDIIAVLEESFLLGGTARIPKRRGIVYQRIFSNPIATGVVFEALQGSDPAEKQAAKALFKRFGRAADPDQLLELLQSTEPPAQSLVSRALTRSKAERTVRKLEDLWRSADSILRKRIAAILYRRPNQRSLEALERVRGEMDWATKLRASLAKWNFRFAVWPWPARAGFLLFAPMALLFLYHGGMALVNPAWPFLLRLRHPFADSTEKAAIIDLLATHYAEDEATDRALIQLFHQNRGLAADPMQASLTRALLRTHGGDPDLERTELGNTLLVTSQTFADHLPDSAAFERALGVLRFMADAPNPVLADTAVGLLRGFVLKGGSESPKEHRLQTIDSLGTLRFDRALPTLDTLLSVPQDVEVEARIRNQLERAAVQAYAEMRGQSDLPTKGPALLSAISRLRNPTPLIKGVDSALTAAVNQSGTVGLATSCDPRQPAVCDDKAEGRSIIAAEPSSERGYRDLLNHYLEDTLETASTDSLFQEAAREFVQLKQEHPGSLWPRKILAELYHEYLPPSNNAYFISAYKEMAALRALPAYEQLKTADTPNYHRFEADFVEIALSARRYKETEQVARQLLQLTDRPLYRLNLALFIYMAHVMSGNGESARASLTELEQVVGKLPENFYNGWIYPGTIEFIRTSRLPDSMKKTLTQLCKEGYWYGRKEAKEILAENRSALKLLDPLAAVGRR